MIDQQPLLMSSVPFDSFNEVKKFDSGEPAEISEHNESLEIALNAEEAPGT